ncbi:MAG: Stp1/IreP family PP2C-type Ser/Thr phosphatase [Planctomycetota bacterium]
MDKQVEIACTSDVGMVRKENQDHFGILHPEDPEERLRQGALVVVADGMGGHSGGIIASHTTVDTILEVFGRGEACTMRAMVGDAIRAANDAVRAKAEADPALREMGTTCVALHVRGPHVLIGHLGDSRCYLVRDDRLEQVTRDHTYLNELIDMGLLTSEQAQNHPDRNIITRCVGMAQQLDIDFNRRSSRVGDRYVLCSDGLTNMVDDSEILEITLAHPPKEASEKLVALANERGGDDNITVAIAHLKEIPAADEDLVELDRRDGEVTPSRTPVVSQQDVDRITAEATKPTKTGELAPDDLEETQKTVTGEMEVDGFTPARDKGDTAESPEVSDGDSGTHPAWFWIIGVEIVILVLLQIWISRL